jgi:flagellar hook-associated protein FlgK
VSIIHRAKYLEKKTKGIQNRVADAYEYIYDGEFDEAVNAINSAIKELYDLRKNIQP